MKKTNKNKIKNKHIKANTINKQDRKKKEASED